MRMEIIGMNDGKIKGFKLGWFEFPPKVVLERGKEKEEKREEKEGNEFLHIKQATKLIKIYFERPQNSDLRQSWNFLFFASKRNPCQT